MDGFECHLVKIAVDILNTSLLYRPSAAMTIPVVSVYFIRSGSGWEETEAEEGLVSLTTYL